MTERKIKELIEIAIGQLAYSYTPYSTFGWDPLCLEKME